MAGHGHETASRIMSCQLCLLVPGARPQPSARPPACTPPRFPKSSLWRSPKEAARHDSVSKGSANMSSGGDENKGNSGELADRRGLRGERRRGAFGELLGEARLCCHVHTSLCENMKAWRPSESHSVACKQRTTQIASCLGHHRVELQLDWWVEGPARQKHFSLISNSCLGKVTRMLIRVV